MQVSVQYIQVIKSMNMNKNIKTLGAYTERPRGDPVFLFGVVSKDSDQRFSCPTAQAPVGSSYMR